MRLSRSSRQSANSSHLHAAPCRPHADLSSVSAYLPGALVLARSLREVHTDVTSPIQKGLPDEQPFQTVCLVTPNTLDVSTVRALREEFDLVVGVEEIGVSDVKDGYSNLELLGKHHPQLNPRIRH